MSPSNRPQRTKDPVARALLAILLVLHLISLAILAAFAYVGLQVRQEIIDVRSQVESSLSQVGQVTEDLQNRLDSVDETIGSLRDLDLGTLFGR